MFNLDKFFIDGVWGQPVSDKTDDLIDPSTEEVYARVSLGATADVERAVAAARRAFITFSMSEKSERVALLKRILAAYDERYEDIARAISREMGAPLAFSRDEQARAGRIHLEATITSLERFDFRQPRGSSMLVWEPIGVCALITPWNWPLNQIVCKVAPAIATGCTIVLKPSEITPWSALIFAEVMEVAGTPPGVFNLVNGTGSEVGQALAQHPDVDMVSFTGSTRAGIMVAKTAADTVKRVAQELGGKSANILLPDADFPTAVAKGVEVCMSNSGQSCDAPSRMLVPAGRHEECLAIAKKSAEALRVGEPNSAESDLGPVVSKVQFDKIQRLIEIGLQEGATLVAGGPGRPAGLNRGFYVRPTVFGHVRSDMTIAREEIFGPVLAILSYEDEDEAVSMANDTVYGLAAYVQSTDKARAQAFAGRMRAGSVYINHPDLDTFVPFGGYKQSGNGREYAEWGMHDFLEIKGIVGWGQQKRGSESQLSD